IVFAGFAIFIMGIDYLFFHRKTEKKVNKLMLAIPILVVVLTFLSWELNKGLVSYEIIETVDIEEHITSFINFDFMPHQREIIRSFPEVMNERGLLYNRMVNVSTVGIVGYGIVGLMLYLTINKEKDNKRVIVNFLTIAFCFISYVMFLVVLYLFVFPLYEASLYPSFSRYILPFIIAIAMLVMGFMIKNITTKQNRDAIAYSVILVTLVIMLTDISIIRTLFDGEISGYDRRRSAEYRASIIKDNTDLQSRIWFWSFGVNRASRNDTIFLAYPHRIASREWCFNLPDDTETGDRARRFSTMPAGLPYGETAEYTVGYTPYEIKEILYNEFDYVFLHGIMEEFIYNFKGVFENPDEITWRSLYKVVRGEEMQDTRLRRVAK
ncbi:MAG: hypothetical protein FWC68_04030, partial [Oscillospiraceae bacterium]|nr:hypothetical protein [Oscillospiraceae bacterium]